MMSIEEHIEYWIKSSEHDYEVFQNLFKLKNNDWCLFIGHLILEKILKAHIIKNTNNYPPKIHDLVRLAELTTIVFEEDKLNYLEKVNTFNISARYPDEKLRFYKLCTNSFTLENFNKIRDLFLWLKSTI